MDTLGLGLTLYPSQGIDTLGSGLTLLQAGDGYAGFGAYSTPDRGWICWVLGPSHTRQEMDTLGSGLALPQAGDGYAGFGVYATPGRGKIRWVWVLLSPVRDGYAGFMSTIP